MLSDIWQERVAPVVFDEAHCMSEDFRPDYKEMSQLRSFFKVPILAVTATTTLKVKEDKCSILLLEEDKTTVVAKSADRPNIFISCQKKSSDYVTELFWLVDHIKSKGARSKKTVIYCRSIDMVSKIFIALKDTLGKYAYADLTEDSDHLLIEMFHKCTHESSKQRILQQFSKEDSKIRCITATVALGMGIDIPDIGLVVHIGCPKSTISYWQEAGRCARDGRNGYSIILYDNFSASLKTTEKTISEIVKNPHEKCIRKQIMHVFSISDDTEINNVPCEGCDLPVCSCACCKCCSICLKKCKCSDNKSYDVQKFLSINLV